MTKYEPIHEHITAHAADPNVTLTFHQIEGILGFALPASARSRPSVYRLSPHMASMFIEILEVGRCEW